MSQVPDPEVQARYNLATQKLPRWSEKEGSQQVGYRMGINDYVALSKQGLIKPQDVIPQEDINLMLSKQPQSQPEDNLLLNVILNKLIGLGQSIRKH
jgi:hypothetical protein